MTYYTPVVGIITHISTKTTGTSTSGCTLLINMNSENQGSVNILLPSTAYVLNGRQFQIGDRATFFYLSQAPAPLIYPPQYRAVAAAYTPYGSNAALDVFNSALTNTENSLVLSTTANTPVTLQNGQNFWGELGGKLLMVLYGATTRSIPAQTTPEQIVVFCTGE